MPWPNNRKKLAKTTSAALLACAAALAAGSLAAQPGARGGTQDGILTESAGLQTLRRARDTLMGISDFDAALNPARTIVERQESGTPDADYPKDLTALARIHAETGNFDTAETGFIKAIDLIEAAEGEFSITLVDPYRALGRSYIKAARYPEAITALEEAQHISQRNLGLFNVEQTPLLDDITTAYLGIGDTVEAREMQLERLDNAMKRYGVDDPRVYPFRYQLADYYQRSRMQLSAREQYEEVLKSQETQLGANDPALLSPLRQLMKIDLMMTQGEDDAAHARLTAILERSADLDPVERGLSLAMLGDWATVTGDAAAARAFYQQAWGALSSKPDVDVASYFATPIMLDFIAPLSAVDRGARSKPYSWAQITFRFDLSADGRPFNVQTVGREGPPGPIEARYNRRLREAHFRPRIVAGEPVATDNVQFTHYFRFYVEEEDEEQG
jgi:tetratricopeptide (TPR) repeat protein